MNVLVTGATGFIGEHLCKTLAKEGITVHALYRAENKAKILISKNIKLFKGEVNDVRSLEKAMQNCTQVYHVAAFAKVWDKDPNAAWKINVEGTRNVLNIAQKIGIQKIVYVSTAGVYGPSQKGTEVSESSNRNKHCYGMYEQSKAAAEELIRQISNEFMPVVIVNPTRVFGPGQLTESNSVTKMIIGYKKGSWRVIPGNGKSKGNYVYVNDVVNGLLQAMANGRGGENYILGGENVDYNHFFNLLSEVCSKKHILFHMPLGIMLTVAKLMEAGARYFSISPKITQQLVRKFNLNWELTSEKACQELGYAPTPLKTAFAETLKWFEKK
jgi:farnesol dehydrogenase